MINKKLVAILRSGLSEFPDWEDAADRIEALTAEMVRVTTERDNHPSWQAWQYIVSAGYEQKARAEKAEAERDAAVQFLTEAVADLKLGERDYTSKRGKECLAFLAKIKEGKL